GADADPGNDTRLRPEDTRHLLRYADCPAVHGSDHGRLHDAGRRSDRDRRMISLNWLPETAYFYVLIFARVGSILMLIPALGEQTIPARMRLSFALLLAAVLYPIVQPTLPPFDGNLVQALGYLLHELAIGL